MTPDEWLERRTFAARDADPARQAHAKRAAGTRVSVCLPALDVAGTVGPIVAAIRDHWCGPGGLVDELIVIDSRSTDATAARAAEAGATVVQDHDVLPEAGPGAGKGEAMWKSLHASTGDLVLWIDADIVDFDPGFVPAMLAPLLADPEIGYVKAVYRRKLGDSDDGGRVTEIAARPLLSAFYPELSVLAQPLSGEAAGRRGLLERVPFLSGYAVEVALLIDILGAAGLAAISQVDLGERRHTNQSTVALGRMGYAILRAVLHRAQGRGLDADGPYLRPQPDDGAWRLTRTPVPLTERPPISTLAGYRAVHPA